MTTWTHGERGTPTDKQEKPAIFDCRLFFLGLRLNIFIISENVGMHAGTLLNRWFRLTQDCWALLWEFTGRVTQCQVYPKTPLYINAQSGSRLFWCLTGLCGNWAWLCMAVWPATEPVTSSSGYSHQCQLQGSRNRRRLELQEQLCAPNTLTYIFAFM